MNPNIAEKFLANLQKVGGWFQRMTSKEARTAYKQVQDIKAKFLDALAERGYEYKAGKVIASAEEKDKEKTAEAVDEGVRFSIKTVEGIGKVAYIDEDVIQRKPGQSYTDAVKEYFETYLKGMQIPVESSGDTVTVQQKKKFFDKTSFEKNQAVQILDDIIRIGENKVHKENFETDRAGNKKKHSGLSAERGWDYYNTNFEIGDTIYSARVIIRKSGNGVDYFYDLDNIKKSRYTTRRMGTESQTTVRDGVSTDDSISQSSANVNPESEKSDVRFSRAENNSARQDSLDNAKKNGYDGSRSKQGGIVTREDAKKTLDGILKEVENLETDPEFYLQFTGDASIKNKREIRDMIYRLEEAKTKKERRTRAEEIADKIIQNGENFFQKSIDNSVSL